MTTLYYTTFNTYEIIDGGDNMLMVKGRLVKSMWEAKLLCDILEGKRRGGIL